MKLNSTEHGPPHPGARYRTWSVFHYGTIRTIKNDQVVIEYDAGGVETVPAFILRR